MPNDPAQSFEPHRQRLTRLAYQMLGSMAEAEDMAQEAFLRWHATDRTRVENPRAFLGRTVTRLCLDQMKSARARHETYIGPWLPEPVLQPADDDGLAETADMLSTTLLLALERLSPLERAAFLLHDVFDMDFTAIAASLGRSEAACRQLASRARQHVQQAKPRFPVPASQGQAIAQAFLTASESGDASALISLLAQDAVILTDGGGIRSAARNPIFGRDRALRFYQGLAHKMAWQPQAVLFRGLINGLPGYVTREQDGLPQVTSFAIDQGVIAAIYVVRNPEKLRGLPGSFSP